VFAGQYTANPRVPIRGLFTASGFFLQISTAVSGLTANGAAATIATTLTIASSTVTGTSPFSSSFLAQSPSSLTPPSVSTGDGQSQSFGLLAGSNIGPVSTGTSTTGSYMLDLMRALATVGSLSSSQVNDPNFAQLMSDTQTRVIGAISSMSTDVGILGEQQASLTTLSTTLSDTQVALTGQLSTAQNVDMASTLSNLSFTQTQLQESYQLIAAASGMSLAKFLPAA
jgi:flagellar hook-associated protein 3 FlgL